MLVGQALVSFNELQREAQQAALLQRVARRTDSL